LFHVEQQSRSPVKNCNQRQHAWNKARTFLLYQPLNFFLLHILQQSNFPRTVKPEAPEPLTATEIRTVAWLAKSLGRSTQGVRNALTRLAIEPSVIAARIPLYPEEPTLSLLRKGMRSANQVEQA
jgi:hypothetical protein